MEKMSPVVPMEASAEPTGVSRIRMTWESCLGLGGRALLYFCVVSHQRRRPTERV